MAETTPFNNAVSLRGVFSSVPVTADELDKLLRVPEPAPLIDSCDAETQAQMQEWTNGANDELRIFREMVLTWLRQRGPRVERVESAFEREGRRSVGRLVHETLF
jgi:hypothetical protein